MFLPVHSPLILLENGSRAAVFQELGMSTKKAVLATFGQRLAHLRVRQGFTQTELAERIGVSQRVVCYYERETEYPPTHLLGKIAEALNVSLEELMGTVTVKNESIPKNGRLKRKLQMVETLPAQDQKAILRMIEAFVARRRMEKAS